MEFFDTIIIGGGPAGISAAVYAARKKMKTALIAESLAGQSVVAADIQNWIGETHISGVDLAKKLEAHVRSYSEVVEIKLGERVVTVKSIDCTEGRVCDFEIKTDKNNIYNGKTVILCSGSRRRKLGVPGEEEFQGKGVSYCSTCDAPLFKDKKVAVLGGGNSGLEAVLDLYLFAGEVYLLESGGQLRGDPLTQEKVKKNPKLKEIILNAKILQIVGETLVSGLKYQVHTPGVSGEKMLAVEGVFVEIGSVPNSEMVKDLVQLNDRGEVMINFQHARTSHPGIFAAGDVTDDPYKQNNISVGDGVRAALSAYNYLLNIEKKSPAEEKYEMA